MLLDARFRGHDGVETTDFPCELLGQDTRSASLTGPLAQIFEHLFGRFLGENAAELAAIVGHHADVFDDEIVTPPLVVLGDQAGERVRLSRLDFLA